MATKAETFPDYLQRVASDMRESAIGHDSPTADDLDMAAAGRYARHDLERFRAWHRDRL